MQSGKRKNSSIFKKLLFPSLFIVLFIVITLNVIFFNISLNNIKNNFREVIRQQMDRLNQDLTHIKDELIVTQQILVANPIVDNFLMSPKYNYEVNARALEKLFVEYIDHIDSIQGVSFVDYLGREKVRVDRISGRIKKYSDFSESDLFHQIISDTRDSVGATPPFIDEKKGVMFSVGVNVIDGDLGEFGGAIIADFSFEEFIKSLEKIKIKDENTIWIFSPDGELLSRPKNDRATFDPRPYMLPDTKGAEQYYELDEGMLIYQDIMFLPDKPFIRVAITIPSYFILEDIKPVVRYSFIFFILFTSVIVIGVYVMSKKFARPIEELSRAASDLAKGDLSTRVDIHADGEVGMLLESFNQMAVDLKSSRTKIIQRNEELDATNEELAATNEELDATNEELTATNEELDAANEELISTNEALNALNEELEERVKERTHALNEAQTIAKLGSWEWDCITDKIHWSDEAFNILGLSLDAPVSSFEQLVEIIHPDDRARFLEVIEKVSTQLQGEPQPLEYRIIMPDGTIKNILDTCVVTCDENDKPLKMTGTIQDITGRKNVQKEKEELWSQLLQSQKMESIGILSGRIAHDFNNMLTPIVGYSSLAFDILPDNSKVKDMVAKIHSTGKKASKIIDQLLSFSKMQVYEKSVLNMFRVISDMKPLLNSLIGEDVKLKIVAAGEKKSINANLTQLQQVVLNLVVNARQAMPDGGIMTIGIDNITIDDDYIRSHSDAVKGDYVVLSVSDTGVGMTPEVQSKIFDPFFTTKSAEKGSGLGLSTVYGIIKQHNGFIWTYSEPGKGSMFKVYLPAVAEKLIKGVAEEPADIPLSERPRAAVQGGNETVLVVDDKGIIHKMIGEILSAKGYNVIEAESADEALMHLETYDGIVDLMVTDVVMPDLNGWELYLKVKEKRPDIKVIFMSGFVENPIVLKDIQERGYPFIKKPVDPHELLVKVRKILDAT